LKRKVAQAFYKSAAMISTIAADSNFRINMKKSNHIILVGFQNQGNLGLGYLAATVRNQGYSVEVFDIETNRNILLKAALNNSPVLIGFSLIFQFYIKQYRELIRFLRHNNIDCHFTMGGHFPSLSYGQTLELVPELDSVVLFEGELTLVELVDHLSAGKDWRNVEGIAFNSNEGVKTTALRPLIKDLDLLPYPDRDFKPMTTLGHAIVPLLASRGCARTCSFCSIQTFYRTAPGKIVRTRQPEKIIDEMKMLYEKQGTTIFLFQDDDFPLYGPVWQRWTKDFLSKLEKSGLPDHTIWKMNCRADAVDKVLFKEMKAAGLYVVYMGLESGNDEGLKTLHKEITVEQNLKAVEILKEIELPFEYGFMLFDPSSSFESIRANIEFLRAIAGDGSVPVTFCRMLPYDGTAIKTDLLQAGRLRGDVCNPDYDFLDPSLNEYYNALTRYVNIEGWIHGYESLTNHLKEAFHEIYILDRLYPEIKQNLREYELQITQITKESNGLLLNVVEELLQLYLVKKEMTLSKRFVDSSRMEFINRFLQTRNSFIMEHQETIIEKWKYKPKSSNTSVPESVQVLAEAVI
jgi:radical SAM superfamily enzyme YgiQ (UPF0313 family)